MSKLLRPFLRLRIEKLSARQRQFLLDHVNGPVMVTAAQASRTRRSLTMRGYITPVDARGHAVPADGRRAFRPTHTGLTDIGRDIVAALLADEAERLTALGCADPAAPPISLQPSDADDGASLRIRERSDLVIS